MSAATTSQPARSDRSARDYLPAAVVSVLSLVIAAPVLAPGYVLLTDQVATPRSFLVPDAWGVGDAVPRAVPLDALVALLTTVVDGQVVQKVLLLAALLLAGWGAAALVPSSRVGTRCVAGVLFLWNPYVAERLVLGHWALLLAYGLLPWLVRSLLRLRCGEADTWPAVGLLLAACAVTPGGGLLSLLVAVPLLAWPGVPDRGRRLVTLASVWLVVNAPWWLPGLLHPGGGRSSSGGVGAFAPRAELVGLGSWGSLLGGGGVWNAASVPTSRTLVTASLLTVLLVGLAVAGWTALRRAWSPGAAAGLAAGGALGFGLAVLTTIPGGASALRWAVDEVPGAGLLRDGQRLVAPLTLLLAVTGALGVERLCTRWAGARVGILVAALALPLLVLPDLAWGVAGRLRPVSYPADWAAVERAMTTGDAVVLPWQPFRQFTWNDGRTALDPMPRYVRVTTLTSDTLVVGDTAVSGGEAPRAAEVSLALTTGKPLVETLPPLGVSWVVVERETPGEVAPRLLVGAQLVVDGPTVRLYRVGDVPGPGGASYAPVVAVADGLAVVVVVALGMVAAAPPRRRRRTTPQGERET